MKKLGFGVVFIFLMFFYVKTLLPSVGFWDTAEFQTVPYTFDIAHQTGYPTYILLGRIFLTIFPIGSTAWRLNLLSALWTATACGLFYLTLRSLKVNLIIAFFSAVFLGLSRTVWETAVRAEVHSLHLFFTALVLLLIIKIINEKNIDFLLLLSFVVGISLGNHMLSIFFLPPYIFLMVIKRRDLTIKKIFFSLILLSLGLSVYILLLFKIDTLDGFFRYVLGSDFSSQMHNWTKGTFLETIKYYYQVLTLNIHPAVLLFSVAGVVSGFKKAASFNFLCLILLIGTLGFSLRYQNAILERYFLASFLVIVLWAAYGINIIYSKAKIIVVVILIAAVYAQVHQNYLKVDQSQNYQAKDYVEITLDNVEDNSMLLAWWSYFTPLRYGTKVENIKSGVKLINAGQNEWEKIALENIDKLPVYFIEKIDLNDPDLVLVPKGNVFKVIRRE